MGKARRALAGADLAPVVLPYDAPTVLSGGRTTNTLGMHLYVSDADHFFKGDNPVEQPYHLALSTHDDLQGDLFFAPPVNGGLTLLVRTRSAAFRTSLPTRWKRR